ncbi:MAG TPA: hypothetical protein ENN46_01465 [Candidatus Woesearchaeota archaeon]|nr:hypothetical protein [Candidatus Woesearchaeota archaeon]
MKEKTKKSLILLLFAIILILPVRAQSVSVTGFGEHEIPGLASSATDEVTLKVDIANVAGNFSEENVRLGTYKITEFDEYLCQKTGDRNYECTVNVGWIGAASCRDYRVHYNTVSGTGTVCLDSKAPNILGITSLRKNFKPSDEIEIIINAEDLSEAWQCAGIASIRLFQGGAAPGSGHLISIDEKGLCDYYMREKIMLNKIIKTADGSTQICAVAEDFFGHKSGEKCIEVFVDGIAPSVQTASFALLSEDKTKKLGEYFQLNRPYKAIPVINISENSETLDVTGEITLKRGETTILKRDNLKASCLKEGQSFSCFFPILAFTLTGSAQDSFTLEYSVLSVDGVGNTGEGKGYIPIKIDTFPPKPVQIISAEAIDPKTLGKSPVIEVKISEQGCGLNEKQVFITSPAFGRKQASECTLEGGNNWVCFFRNIEISDTQHTKTAEVRVTGDSRDDCANRVEQEKSETFLVDTKKPVVLSAEAKNAQGELFIKEGDELVITAEVSDDSDRLYISGDFSKVTESQGVVKGTCEKSGDSFTCSLKVSGLKASSDDVRINIHDKANNTATALVKVDVFRRDESEDRDFWVVSNERLSPDIVDRSLASKTNMRVFLEFDLLARSPGQALISIKNLRCQGEQTKIQETRLLFTPDRNPGSKRISVYMELSKQQLRGITKDVIACTMDLTTFTGDTITTSPEKETIEVELKFYDGFAGAEGDKAYDKIRNRGEIVSGLKDNYILDLIRWYNIFQDSCNAFLFVAGTTEAINLLAVADFEPISKLGLTGVASSLNEVVGSIAPFAEKACNVIACNNLDPKVFPRGAQLVGWNDRTCRGDSINYELFMPDGDDRSYDITVRCPDPKNNMVTALFTGCWPYVVVGGQRLLVIEASTLDCYINAIENNMPIYHCDSMQWQMYCEWVLGDALEAWPLSQASSKMRDIVLNTLEDPLSMAVTLFSLIQPKLPETTVGTLIIVVAETADTFARGVGIYQGFQGYISGRDTMAYVKGVADKYDGMRWVR